MNRAAQQQLDELVKQLQVARNVAGLSQRRLAVLLGVSSTSVADWETRRDLPTTAHLILWAQQLDLRLVITDPAGSPELPSDAVPDPDEPWETYEMRRLATALWTRRRARKMSQTALGKLIGINRISMQRWENVTVMPRSIGLAAWAIALDCTIGLQ